jgi:hypothetical protein
MLVNDSHHHHYSSLYLESIKVEGNNWEKKRVKTIWKKRSRAAVKSPTFRSSYDNTRLSRPAAYPHCDGGPMQRFFASPPLIQSVSEAELVLRW